MADEELEEHQERDDGKIIQPQKVFLKDASFESPNSPEIFLKKWDPSISFEIDRTISELGDDNYEVVLVMTVTATVDDTTAYLTEVQQAGIFTMTGFEAEALEQLHNIYCLRYLYAFANAALADLVNRGGFPQLLLAPLNFTRVYQDRIKAAAAEET